MLCISWLHASVHLFLFLGSGCQVFPFFRSTHSLHSLFLSYIPLFAHFNPMNGHARQDYIASKPLPPPARNDLPPIPPVNEPDNAWSSGPPTPSKFQGDSLRGPPQAMMNGLSPRDSPSLSPNDGAYSAPLAHLCAIADNVRVLIVTCALRFTHSADDPNQPYRPVYAASPISWRRGEIQEED